MHRVTITDTDGAEIGFLYRTPTGGWYAYRHDEGKDANYLGMFQQQTEATTEVCHPGTAQGRANWLKGLL